MEQSKRGRCKYLTIDEIAEELSLSRVTIYNEIVKGNLKAKRFGKKSIRVHVNEFERYQKESEFELGQYR